VRRLRCYGVRYGSDGTGICWTVSAATRTSRPTG
jgi:hypothetical protein